MAELIGIVMGLCTLILLWKCGVLQDEIEELKNREPVAYRWRYEGETKWTLCKNRPEEYIDREIQELYL